MCFLHMFGIVHSRLHAFLYICVPFNFVSHSAPHVKHDQNCGFDYGMLRLVLERAFG